MPFTTKASATGISLDVHAVILPWMKYRLDQQQTSYTVDAAALDRGHVDLPAAAVISLHTNQRSTFLLRPLNPPGLLIREATAGFAPFTRRVRVEGNVGGAVHAIDCRILLAEDTLSGIYPLNLDLGLLPH